MDNLLTKKKAQNQQHWLATQEGWEQQKKNTGQLLLHKGWKQ